MTSKKCPRCGLVNWNDAESCKRCKSPLNEPAETPAATTTATSNEPGPQLTVCGVCGGANDVNVRNITRKYTPNWVWFFLPFGILPAGLLGMALQVKHSFSLPVCEKCMTRHGLAGVVSWLSIVVCLFIMIFAAGFGLMSQSWLAFLIPMAFVVGIALFAGWFDKKANPRYVAFTKQRVEIDVPGKGRILVLDKAPA